MVEKCLTTTLVLGGLMTPVKSQSSEKRETGRNQSVEQGSLAPSSVRSYPAGCAMSFTSDPAPRRIWKLQEDQQGHGGHVVYMGWTSRVTLDLDVLEDSGRTKGTLLQVWRQDNTIVRSSEDCRSDTGLVIYTRVQNICNSKQSPQECSSRKTHHRGLTHPSR
jgi:hypothetical protein